MKNDKHDLLLLLKTWTLSGTDFERHLECVRHVLLQVENNDAFCSAHELATRLKITQKKRTILHAASEPTLKPFYFLINKN